MLAGIAGCAGSAGELQREVTQHGGRYVLSSRGLVLADFTNTKITDDDLGRIKDIRSLGGLVLRHTAIDDDGLVHLKSATQLATLDLSHTQISDAGLQQLLSLPKLSFLVIEGCDVTELTVENFHRERPDVVIISDAPWAKNLEEGPQ